MRLQLSDARFDNPFSYSSIVRASMPKLIEPSRSRVGCPNTTTSATIWDGELGVCQLTGHPIVDVFRTRPRNPKAQLMAFADECQRLPVS